MISQRQAAVILLQENVLMLGSTHCTGEWGMPEICTPFWIRT